MFNLKQAKTSKIQPIEQYLRKENIGPKADEDQPVIEKAFNDHKGRETTITEDQMDAARKSASSDKSEQIIEKVLNEAGSSGYVTHRAESQDLLVPPINTLVENLRKERMSEFKTEKESNWTVSFDDKKQNGSLPKWPKMTDQHDKIVLNNDPRRFESEKKVTPLVGGITVAHIDQVVNSIKTGQSIEFDRAILTILQGASKENRELTKMEQQSISGLKIARTQSLVKLG